MTSETSIEGSVEPPSESPASGGRDARVLLPARPAASALDRSEPGRVRGIVGGRLARQAGSFALVGIASTAAYVVLYAALRELSVSATAANAIALLVTAIGNTAANRRLTFAVQGREGLARDHAAGLAAFGIALVITSASLGALDLMTKRPGRILELAVLVVANGLATLVRFLMLRYAINRGGTPVPAPARETTTS